MMPHDPSIWLPATKAVLVSVMLITLVYRIGRALARRRTEQRRTRHHRMLLDLGEARQVVAQIQAPRNGLVSAEEAGRLLSADGWALAESMPAIQRQRLAHHLEDVARRVNRSLDAFLAHERGEVSGDCVIHELERLRSYCRVFAAEFSTPVARTAAKGRR